MFSYRGSTARGGELLVDSSISRVAATGVSVCVVRRADVSSLGILDDSSEAPEEKTDGIVEEYKTGTRSETGFDTSGI